MNKLINSTVTIASGASTSGTIDCNDRTLTGFVTPAAWTTAALTIEASMDGTTWIGKLFDSTSTATGSYPTVTASSGYAVDINALLPWRYLRLRSGTSDTPVVQAAARSFTVIARVYQ